MNEKNRLLYMLLFKIAGLIMAVGLVIVGITLCFVGFDFGKLSTRSDEEFEMHNEKVSFNEVDLIHIDTVTDAIEISVADGDDILLEYSTSQYRDYEFSVKNGALHLKEKQLLKRKWFFFNIDFGPASSDYYPHVELKIPRRYLGDLKLETNTGWIDTADINLSGTFEAAASTGSLTLTNFSAKEASLAVTTGHIYLTSVSSDGNMLCTSTTGHIELDHVNTGGDLVCTATTGRIYVGDTSVSGSATATANTGKVSLINVEAETFINCTTTTGNIELGDIKVPTLGARCTTGKISGENLDVQTSSFDANTGSIDISMPGSERDYNISTNTNTGSIEINDEKAASGKYISQTSAPNSITASTTTGSIYIDFADYLGSDD